MLGDTIDAETADRYGLVSELVDDDATRRRRAPAGAGASPTGRRSRTRRPSRCSPASSTCRSARAMELDAMTQALLMTTDDHAEFHAAFNEKRPPEWKGR